MRVLFIVLLLSLLGLSLACKVDPELVQLAIDVAKQEGIQPELLIAVVWVESRFCPDAVSPAGAIGLGQLMPGTANDLGVNPENKQDNLQGSSRYLLQQFERFQNWHLALAAYNAGPNRVVQAEGIPLIKETQSYVKNTIYIYQSIVDAIQ